MSDSDVTTGSVRRTAWAAAYETAVSRRGFLIAASAGAGAVMIWGAPDGSAAYAQPLADSPDGPEIASGSQLSLTAQRTESSEVFSKDWAQLAKVQFPTSLSIWTGETGGTLDISWDPRVFSFADTVYCHTTASSTLTRITPEALNEGSLRLSLPANVRQLTIPVIHKNLYPDDSIDAPVGTSCRLTTAGSTVAVDLPVEAAAVHAWGAEILPLWAESRGAVYPAGIRVQSVGPEATPSGLMLDVSTDERLALRTASAVADGPSSSNGRAHRRISVGLLNAGQAMDVAFEIDPEEGTERLKRAYLPAIALEHPADDQRGRRNTGKSFVTALLPSGGEISSFEEYESA